MSTSKPDEHPLPYGWIKEFDPIANHVFYVDTKATPPRSIWTHPYEDEQYLSEHPDVREKVGKPRPPPQSLAVPPEKARRHSYSGTPSDNVTDKPDSGARTPGPSSSSTQKRGFFSKIKDSVIGTKEEREAERKRSAQLHEQRRQERLREQAYYAQQYQQQQQQQQFYQQQQYQQYGRGYGPGQGYAPPFGNPSQQRRGFGGGGMALPLLGGLAGGLLLGDILDGGLIDGPSGFDGGGFDGGGFDGGFF